MDNDHWIFFTNVKNLYEYLSLWLSTFGIVLTSLTLVSKSSEHVIFILINTSSNSSNLQKDIQKRWEADIIFININPLYSWDKLKVLILLPFHYLNGQIPVVTNMTVNPEDPGPIPGLCYGNVLNYIRSTCFSCLSDRVNCRSAD